MTRPRVFIGSSVEGMAIAEHLQLGLDYHAQCTLWSQGVFGLSGGTLDSLYRATAEFDFAILVLTADDLVQKRGMPGNSPRDNVLFELGLFMGALGRERTFGVYRRDQRPDLPSDLAGITLADFEMHSDGNLLASLGPVCVKFRNAMSAVGLRSAAQSDNKQRDITQILGQLEQLKMQLDAQSERFFEKLSSLTAGTSRSEKPLSSSDIGFLEGVWSNRRSTYCMRFVAGKLRCAYCYLGDDELTGEYHSFRRVNEMLLGQFKWFSGEFSGYFYMRIESQDRLVGGWWLGSDEPPSEVGPHVHGFESSVWIRKKDARVPPWAEAYFREISK